ncbi:hypothetical protein HK102_004570 [Quaeritorhiza haematococci]|nr:hypothetical protein HK102_004570 [Quaeritorhiza haematococci]
MPSYRLRHPAYPKGTEKQGMDPPAQLSHPAYPWERAQIPQTHEVGGPQSGLSPVLNHPLQVELEHDQRAHTQDDLRYPRLESYGLQHPPYIFQLPELQSEQSQQTQSPPSLTELKTISSLPRSPSLTRNRSFQQISPHLQSQRPSMLSNGTTVADPLGLIIGARILDMPCVGKPSYPPAVDNNINDTPPFSLHVSEPSQRMRIEKVIEITPEVPEMPREVAEGLGQTNAGGGSVIGENQGGSTTVMENLLMPVNAPGGDGIIGLGLYDIEESVGGVVGWHVIPSAGEPHGQLVSSVVETLTTASPYKEIKPENSSPGEDDSDGALSISIPSLTSNDESLLARSSSLELATLSSASSPPNLKRKVDISFDGPEYQYWAPSPSLSSCLSRDPKRSRFDNESAPNDGMEAADSHYKAPTMTPLTTVMDDASGSHLLRSMPSQKVNGVEKDFLVPLHSRKLSNMEPPVIMSIWNSKSLRATFFS